MNIFNIRRLETRDIPQELLKPGVVSILGDPDYLAPYAGKVYDDILHGIDIKTTYYHYDLQVKSDYPELSEYLEANVICPLPNPIIGNMGLVVTSANPPDLGLAVVVIMNEVENMTRLYSEQVLALFSLGAPSELRELVNIWYSIIKLANPSRNISFRGRRKSSGKESGTPIYDTTSSDNRITEKQIKEVYENLPERYSELYAKKNPEAAAILRFSLELIDPRKNLAHLLIEAAKADRNLLKKLYKTKTRIASQYSIRVKKWSNDQERHFNDFYRYCLYFVDRKGVETPIKFHNRPSYCIYLMYVLDRYNKQELVTDLSYKENQNEFKRLYSEIMLEDPDQIDSFCNTMLRRQNPESGSFRKGRYDDYLKDISITFDDLVGSPDSMVFKVGHGQFLQIEPSKIEIDENLPKFTFV